MYQYAALYLTIGDEYEWITVYKYLFSRSLPNLRIVNMSYTNSNECSTFKF